MKTTALPVRVEITRQNGRTHRIEDYVDVVTGEHFRIVLQESLYEPGVFTQISPSGSPFDRTVADSERRALRQAANRQQEHDGRHATADQPPKSAWRVQRKLRS